MGRKFAERVKIFRIFTISLVFDRFQKFKKTKVSTWQAKFISDLEFDIDLQMTLTFDIFEISKNPIFVSGAFTMKASDAKFYTWNLLMILYKSLVDTFSLSLIVCPLGGKNRF